MIKGFIFDMDGTLIDSVPVINTVDEKYLREHGVEPKPEILRKLMTMNYAEAVSYFHENVEPEKSPEQIFSELKEQIVYEYLNNIPAKDGVKEFLERAGKKNIKMCVATVTDKTLAAAVLKRAGILEYFSFIITTDELATTKHEPLIFDRSAEMLELGKDEVLIFEDSLYCIETAVNAGYKVAAVYDEASECNAEKIKKLSSVYLENINDFDLEKM